MSDFVHISHPTGILKGTFPLPASKSEANRALIIQAVSGGLVQIENLSEAKDTQIMQQLLAQKGDGELNVGHAGTVMRFLTAFLAFQPRDVVLKGSERMQERPIGPLVEALRTLGAEIEYLENEGFPPLYIFGRNAKFRSSEVAIRGDVSSQFISALLMIAPALPEGLRLKIEGELISRPYVEMTLALMRNFGAKTNWEGNAIRVEPGRYRPGKYTIESDWSAAGYAYSMAALAQEADIFLPGLRQDSLQGDAKLAEIMEDFGVDTAFEAGGARLTINGRSLPETVNLNLLEMPDQAQTLIPMAGALGIPGTFSGLQSLRLKETDRILALQEELAICTLLLQSVVPKGSVALSGEFTCPDRPIRTYEDHRMAMGFAPLILRCPGKKLSLHHPHVVEKSFPAFWQSLEALGFEVSF